MNLQSVRMTLKNKGFDIFTTREFAGIFALPKKSAAVKLSRYKKSGYLASPKRGVYFFADNPPDKFRLASYLYRPSYISLDTVLSKEGIIPEAVYPITSVTTKSTREFSDGETLYTYSRIKKEAFTGYRKEGDAFVALPEKALADYLYFVSQGKRNLNDRINFAKINKEKLFEYAALFNDKRLKNLLKKIYKND